MKKISVAILGGSGYAGGELIRLLLNHPNVSLEAVTSRAYKGKFVYSAHPNLRGRTRLQFIDPHELSKYDLLFVALPNGVSMNTMSDLMKKASKIIDLGADFRLNSAQAFTDWYHMPHTAPKLMKEFIYGVIELHRSEIAKSNYVACGGCEATVSILSLYPLIKHSLIETKIIIDAKMSSSQAGLVPTLSSHHPERSGVVRSYMPTGHRHTAEIITEMTPYTSEPLDVAISATSLDMVRGILVTIHTTPRTGVSEKDIWRAYREEYENEPFIRIVKERSGLYRYPEPKILAGTNFCDIGFEMDTRSKRLVVIGAIDNLVKGTAGQAMQDMNCMFGFEETTGLEFLGLHPI
ncbi:MAG: N-acetyl-gamma-glutamyl-phosphate reductase [Candidatus Roizmanbacteria bacterium]|nr:N-acetyl-gamma-glutamyl-phosphate reductase [Candidatus Roizmanbacteria bacterium]